MQDKYIKEFIDKGLVEISNFGSISEFADRQKIFYPAEKFENISGLSGVSKKYNLPNDLNEEDIEKFIVYYSKIVFFRSKPDNQRKIDFSKLLKWNKDNLRNGVYTDKELKEINSRPFGFEYMNDLEIAYWQDKEQEYMQNLDILWSRLTELNPSLGRLELDKTNFFDIYHAIMGVTSRLNRQDIQHFINIQNHKLSSKEEKHYKTVFNKVANKLDSKHPFEWVPSSKSLKKIAKKLKIR